MNTPTIQKIKNKKFTWIDVSQCEYEEMQYLKKTFDFRSAHINDCLSKIQRPKLDLENKYIFMVLLFPVYDRKTRKIKSSEVDFFIGPDYLITIHRSEINPLMNFFNSCKVNLAEQEKYLTEKSSVLLYEILRNLFDYCVPILDALNSNISSIEENVFKGYEKKMVREILIAKTNIVNFRKIMQAHRSVIFKLANKGGSFFPSLKYKDYLKEILESTEDIWANLENLKQNIEAIENTNNSLISFQLNDVIKILTTISAIILPITLIAGIFSMNLKFMPLSDQPFAFWLITGLMIIVFAFLFHVFKNKKWL
jgi:magnesium transporter